MPSNLLWIIVKTETKSRQNTSQLAAFRPPSVLLKGDVGLFSVLKIDDPPFMYVIVNRAHAARKAWRRRRCLQDIRVSDVLRPDAHVCQVRIYVVDVLPNVLITH